MEPSLIKLLKVYLITLVMLAGVASFGGGGSNKEEIYAEVKCIYNMKTKEISCGKPIYK